MTFFPSRALLALGIAALAGCAVDSAGDPSTESDDLVSANPQKIAATKFSTTTDLTRPAAFVSHPDYLALNVAASPAAAILAELDAALGARLKSRGEAHITVLTPPEVSSLRGKLSISAIETLARDLQRTEWTPVCVGFSRAKTNPALQTYYIVVRSEALLTLRKLVQSKFIAAGGSSAAFDANDFRPHITLGFTQRDLFETDGAMKTVATCPSEDNLQLR